MKLWIKVGAGATIVIGLIVVIGAYAWFEIPTTLYPSKHWKEKYQETPPVKLQLSMTNNAVDGMVSNQSDSVITSIVIHVRVREIRKCGETLANVFSDLDWEANCKKNPNHTVEDTVDGQAYECFHGELAPYNAARCYAATAMEFDPSKQIWDFFVLKVKGKPSIDMFGGRGHWYDHITDGLIALFNGLLVLATIALFISAEKSADAAKKSAEIAERALIAGQRAFISVSFDRTAIIDPETGKITAWSFTPVWYNAGDTPTREMQNHVNIRVFDGPLPNDWDFPDLWSANTNPDIRLPTPLGAAPKGAVSGQKVGISIDQMREIIAGPKRLYMWGWATYNDVFPKTPMHVTRFAIQILAGGDPSNKDKISFEFPFIHKYNCSDEECEYQGYPASWKPREITEQRANMPEPAP